VEGENIEDRKVNQPQVPAGEINSSDANPFMSTSKDLTSSRAIIIEEEPERAEGESSQAGALENNTPFFSAKKSPESNITYSSESNESKKDLVVFTSPYHNQIFSDDRLVIAGKYASEDVEEILVNGQTCVLDKENMTFIGPMLISPQEAKELGVAKNSKDYILVKVDQATHSGKNTLRCEVKLNGKKEEKEITYYYYQLFVKRDAYQHDTAIHKFEKDENEEQCFNFNLFNNPPYSLWEELEKNSRGRHPCSIRNNNWYYSLQETSPWFSLSDISYLNWYNGNNCENAKYKGETNYTIHTLPKIDNKLTPMVLILSDCRFVEMYIEQTFDIGEYKINNQELRSANNSINDSTFFVIIDKYSPDSDMLLNVKASSYDSGSNNEMHSWFSFNSVELLQGDIVVDSNNDGVLGGEDNQVEMQSPGHVFWVNNDDDYDESDVHPDDEDAKNSKGNDSGDDYINGIRDLEDFTLVNIKIPHMKDLKKCSGLKFYLRSEGKGKINVFKRLGSDPRNPKLYLNDLSQSIEQYKQKKLFDISAGKDAELNIEDFDMNGVFHGIFEGVKEGDITLKLIVEFGDSGKEKNSIVLDEAIVVIRDIRQFYKCYNLRNGVSINARNVNVYNWKEDKSHQMFFDNPDEIIIFAHGANNSADDAICFFNTFYKRLYHMGYRDGLACINWESDEGSILLPKTYFDGNWINSFQSAEALSEIIKKLHHEYPNAVINIGAHSLGNNLISYALRLLAVKNEIIINNVILMEAAIPGNAYSGTASSASFFNNMYGINTSNVTNCIYNTYSSTDEILPLFRIDLFIGLPTPLDEEYNLIDIHNSLFEYLLKCMMKPYQAWLWDVIVNNKYFHICWSGAMGDRVAHSRYDNFVNHDMHKSKKIDVAGRPYRIRKHCSMSEEYLYDVQEFYNYIIGNNVD
jgi:hypothetical protein